MRFFLLFHRRNIINLEELEKLGNYYHEGKLAHAYLISTNNIEKCMKVLVNVIKNIFCVQEYKDDCNKCSLCHLIDIDNFPCLKIIEPEGQFIKKEKILNLEYSFSKSSQFANVNVYIIKNCEKLNKEAANTMLKFLEEPDGNVIGFFITNNNIDILPTIKSRCQHIKANFDNENYEDINLTKEKYSELYNILKNYIYKIEIEKEKNILYNNEYLRDLEKEDIINIYKIMLNIYKNVIAGKNEDFDYLDKYSFDNIKRKINLIIEILNELMYNVNVDLILDRFVLEMEVINNEII